MSTRTTETRHSRQNQGLARPTEPAEPRQFGGQQLGRSQEATATATAAAAPPTERPGWRRGPARTDARLLRCLHTLWAAILARDALEGFRVQVEASARPEHHQHRLARQATSRSQ